jgi:tetratricopeptide (TPR) repeat protein
MVKQWQVVCIVSLVACDAQHRGICGRQVSVACISYRHLCRAALRDPTHRFHASPQGSISEVHPQLHLLIMRRSICHQLSNTVTRSLSSCRAFSDTSTAATRVFPSRTSLELDETFVQPFLFSIGQLPEIHDAIEARKLSKPVNLDELERATKVFSSIQPGGNEHKAALALLADCQESSAAIKTLQNLNQYQHDSQEIFSIQISLAKALWLNGDFAEAESICAAMLQNEKLLASLSPLHAASARTGQAISRLCLADSRDDIFSVRDPFQMVVKSLERSVSGNDAHALALAQLNLGTAEAIYAQFLSKINNVNVPLDGAMRAWKNGLATLKRKREMSLLSHAIQAQILTQMSWGLLQMEDSDETIKRASEFSGNALKIYDTYGCGNEEGKQRTLAIIATCYHKTGSVVMTEGIFESATDRKMTPNSTLDKLQLQDNLETYAGICKEWEKRERDSQRLSERASDLKRTLPKAWQDKSVLYSTLWFWTPSLFRQANNPK